MKVKRKQKNGPKTRKQLRKEKRTQKKKNRFSYHNVKKKKKTTTMADENSIKSNYVENMNVESDDEISSSEDEENLKLEPENNKLQQYLKREKNAHDEYFADIKKNRVDQLKKANEQEDIIIAKYEKLLKLNSSKRNGDKENSSGKGKFNDGLDYLLELCSDDFDKNLKQQFTDENYSDNDSQDFDNTIDNHDQVSYESDSCDGSDSELESNVKNCNEMEKNEQYLIKSSQEDIYGNQKECKGNLAQKSSKYVSPHLREREYSENDERMQRILSLKRQIKGHINRLVESNLSKIAMDLENIYNSNARNDANTVLSEVLISSLVSNVLCKERLVLEHSLLIAILHANVGSEVGAFLLQVLVKRFEELYLDIDNIDVENKEIDNIIFFTSHLYTFKIFKLDLMYEILKKLSSKLTEKRIECILLVLKSVGFILRKEDPLLLKEFIVFVQKQPQINSPTAEKNSRVAYMMDILMAIKNNNMNKIPQYDGTTVEHFRKLLKHLIRPGNHITTLAISMHDLLNAETRGKWWLVGSAWSGHEIKAKNETISKVDEEREKIFSLAKKHHMNTDAKRNLFYILMTAEDYMDAFEKILSSTNDERSIITVILHVCLSEKSFNLFYCVLIKKLCEHNRKFILAVQYAVWDRIKDIENLSSHQINNLSRFLIFLIEKGTVPLSILKVVDFSRMEKTLLRFMRQIVLGLLITDENQFHGIFEKMSKSIKLRAFKDQLRLFLKVFLLKNKDKSENEKKNQLQIRIKLVEKYLS